MSVPRVRDGSFAAHLGCTVAEDRRTGISGTDVAAIVGLSEYKSPFDVFAEKRGLVPSTFDRPPSAGYDPAHWGRVLQRPIAEEYERQTGRVLVHLYDEPMRHPEREWQIGSPDAIAPSEKLVVEIKTAGLRQAAKYGEPGTDEIPDDYAIQVAWYLSLLDFDRADVAVLLAGQDYRVYHIARDRELEAKLLELAEDFWRRHVVANVPPEITATEKARSYLRQVFPVEREPLRQATDEEALLASVLRAARINLKSMETRCEETENRLKLSIGDAQGIEGPGWRCTWKAAKPSIKVDWEAIARELEPPEELITKHTKPGVAARRFLARFEKEEQVHG